MEMPVIQEKARVKSNDRLILLSLFLESQAYNIKIVTGMFYSVEL